MMQHFMFPVVTLSTQDDARLLKSDAKVIKIRF